MRIKKQKSEFHNDEQPHVTYGNVFADLGFSPKEAETLAHKSDVYTALVRRIQKLDLSRRDLEKILNIPQPRVSDLMTEKIDKFSLEKLLEFTAKLGGRTLIKVSYKN